MLNSYLMFIEIKDFFLVFFLITCLFKFKSDSDSLLLLNLKAHQYEYIIQSIL